MKYDVFISYSRKDYVDENENVLPDSPVKAIMEFLDKNNISYWIDKEGIYSSSQFVELITQAIRDSKMLLFVSSKHSNTSDYTAGEVKEARDTGKAIIPMRIDDTPYSESYRILINMIDHIEFSKTNAFPKLLNAITKEKERIAKVQEEEALRREELEKREWCKSVKNDILEQINELKKLKETRKSLLESIYKKLRSINVLQKQCPICDSKTDIETEYCLTCGWFFPVLTEIEGLGVESDRSALILAKSRWESKCTLDDKDLENEVVALREEIDTLKKRNDKLISQLNSQSSTLEEDKNETEILKCGSSNPLFKYKNILIVILGLLGCFVGINALSTHVVNKVSNEETIDKVDNLLDSDREVDESDSVFLTSGEFVDLGLTVMWASCNVGANRPEDAGTYYAWGETIDKAEYSIETYAYTYNRYGYTQPKRIGSNISASEYDVAYVLSDEKSRMPTKQEMKELVLNCKWEYCVINKVKGMKVIGKNGNSIFIPNVGCKENLSNGGPCYYWTSTADESGTPYSLHISAFRHEYDVDIINHVSVDLGLPVRAVKCVDEG